MWHFLDLNHDQKLERRRLLDLYGALAQVSALIPLALLQFYFLAKWLQRRWLRQHDADAVPSSPHLKKQRLDAFNGPAARLQSFQNKTVWWMGDALDIWGSRVKKGEIAAGVVWTAWLIFLSCLQTQGGMLCLHFKVLAAAKSFNRLSALDKAIRHCRCLAVAFAVSSCFQVTVQPHSTPHQMFLDDIECGTSGSWTRLYNPLLLTRRLLSNLLRPSTCFGKTHQRLGRHSRTCWNDCIYSCRHDCTFAPPQIQLSYLLHHSRYPG